MPTINDVAKYAGVSVGTVSNVLNGKGTVSKQTVKKVLKAVEILGYVPNSAAKNLKSKQSNILGIIVEDLFSSFFGHIIDGISQAAEKENYSVYLYSLRINKKVSDVVNSEYQNVEKTDAFHNDVANAVKVMRSAGVSGIVHIGAYPRNVDDILPNLTIPVVYTYSYMKDPTACTINYDEKQGGQLATNRLIAAGHKKIGVISGSVDSIPTHQRLLGYQTALMDHDIPYRPDYIKTSSWVYEDGFQDTIELLSMPEPPTAIFAMSDIMAYAAINAAHSLGVSVPDELSIHGFDDLEFSWFCTPPLSSIRMPLSSMGEKSVEMLLQLLRGEEVSERKILMPCTQVERASVKNI